MKLNWKEVEQGWCWWIPWGPWKGPLSWVGVPVSSCTVVPYELV